jgi:hypothetical protein
LRVFENRVLRRIFRPYLYSSPNIIRMIESRRVRWPGNVARIGRSAYRILV